MINRIALFLLVLLSINICLVGLGVANEDLLYRMDILDGNTPTQVYAQASVIQPGGVTNTSTGTVYDQTQTAQVVPNSGSTFASFNQVFGLLFGLTFGYSAIFVLLGLPMLIVYLLTAIIGLVQLFAIFYLGSYLIGIFRGVLI